jgi:ribosomal protein S13
LDYAAKEVLREANIDEFKKLMNGATKKYHALRSAIEKYKVER